ncbi:hypothetical protein CAP31_02400 [Sulfuriferula sp. AH1]|uniref:DinB family protein n=1 Tax=Sulfuriferula sp. AH1 TaxID=1985873 RepID=UPI000B3B59F8|nr:DinB family protein [Sulfuriferula sp. AH1]ARU30640.1 hypothetical protein CAP31_02400 [Sulfuriferula sp. AH1]
MSANAPYAWKSYFVVQADYQQWANDRLFAALGRVDADLLTSAQGLYFDSIHHTVDHILLVNRLWFARLRGERFVADFAKITHTDWNQLIEVTQAQARELQLWLEQCDDAFFERQLAYFTTKGEPQQMWMRDVLTHMMTHQVHHRGQISAVITRLGYRSLEMDYVYYKRQMDAYRSEVAAIP